MAERSYRWLFWALAVAGTALDQFSKYGVFRWLYNGGQGGRWPEQGGIFWLEANFTGRADPGGWLAPLRTWSGEIQPYLNPGALFGQRVTEWLDRFRGTQLRITHPEIDTIVFCVVSVLAAVAIVYWTTRRSAARDRALCAALGLILAGTLGNLYDRVVFGGVRDFLHFKVEGVIDWPIFNLADTCLVCGAALLLVQAFWSRPATAGTAGAEAARAPEMAQAKHG
jgi:lipoprotein signal peptidase